MSLMFSALWRPVKPSGLNRLNKITALLMFLETFASYFLYRLIITAIKGFFLSEKEDILSGRSWRGCTRARHAAPPHSSATRAAGYPKTKPSSLHPSACAYDCRAAPPPGNLEHVTDTHK